MLIIQNYGIQVSHPLPQVQPCLLYAKSGTGLETPPTCQWRCTGFPEIML